MSSDDDSSSVSEDKHKKSRKRRRNRSSSSNSSLDSKLVEKLKKKLKKLEKKEKKRKKKKKTRREEEKKRRAEKKKVVQTEKPEKESCNVDISLMTNSQKLYMRPMTKEEYEKKQNTIQKVFDEKTGRTRLVRGDGEILEECVSRERHKAINKQATHGDGEFFQKTLKTIV